MRGVLSTALAGIIACPLSCSHSPCPWDTPLTSDAITKTQICQGNSNGYGETNVKGTTYRGDWRGSKMHGFGEYVHEEMRYVGDHERSERRGLGFRETIRGQFQGQRWWGEFKNDEPNGRGVFRAPDGRLVIGDFKDGKPAFGYAERANPNRNNELMFQYYGELKDGFLGGQGVMVAPNGDVLMGVWEKDEILTGTLFYAARTGSGGDRYQGPFKDYRPHGRGTYRFAIGGSYEGEFVDGNFHGRGVLTYPPEQGKVWRYEGMFQNDRFHGKGTLYTQDGHMYVGEFAEGEPHGHGRLVHRAKGTVVHEGRFEKGKPVGGTVAPPASK